VAVAKVFHNYLTDEFGEKDNNCLKVKKPINALDVRFRFHRMKKGLYPLRTVCSVYVTFIKDGRVFEIPMTQVIEREEVDLIKI
jgi:hypothetical protein